MRGAATRTHAALWLLIVGATATASSFEPAPSNGLSTFLTLIALLPVATVFSLAFQIGFDSLENSAPKGRWLALVAFAFLLPVVSRPILPEWWQQTFSPFASACVAALVIALATTIVSLNRSVERAFFSEEDASSRVAAANRAEAMALRLQLNPHLLFNALNSVAGEIAAGKAAEAEEMLSRLSEFLRASLVYEADGQVPLGAELETLEAYLTIERARFPGVDIAKIDCDPVLDEILVPQFIIQPLVENAIKHAWSDNSTPLVTVTTKMIGSFPVIEVINNVQTSACSKQTFVSTGIGIANVEMRLFHHFGASAKLTTRRHEGRYIATITLPPCDPSEVAAIQ